MRFERLRTIVLSSLGFVLATWAPPAHGDGRVVTYIDDRHAVIAYPGGRYEGGVRGRVSEGLPVWEGPCTFHFKTGTRFEGYCENDRFVRGFLFSRDGRSTRFLARGRRGGTGSATELERGI
ncbi:MAG: hypothetical protein ACE5Q3_15860 [Alphaproteobacteria bacterium]